MMKRTCSVSDARRDARPRRSFPPLPCQPSHWLWRAQWKAGSGAGARARIQHSERDRRVNAIYLFHLHAHTTFSFARRRLSCVFPPIIADSLLIIPPLSRTLPINNTRLFTLCLLPPSNNTASFKQHNSNSSLSFTPTHSHTQNGKGKERIRRACCTKDEGGSGWSA